eukprot:353894-Chlamydomonas_euryale.AAC.2
MVWATAHGECTRTCSVKPSSRTSTCWMASKTLVQCRSLSARLRSADATGMTSRMRLTASRNSGTSLLGSRPRSILNTDLWYLLQGREGLGCEAWGAGCGAWVVGRGAPASQHALARHTPALCCRLASGPQAPYPHRASGPQAPYPHRASRPQAPYPHRASRPQAPYPNRASRPQAPYPHRASRPQAPYPHRAWRSESGLRAV